MSVGDEIGLARCALAGRRLASLAAQDSLTSFASRTCAVRRARGRTVAADLRRHYRLDGSEAREAPPSSCARRAAAARPAPRAKRVGVVRAAVSEVPGGESVTGTWFACRLRMTEARQRLGLEGEDIACEALTERGYAVIDRRYRTKHGEIDVIARHGAYLVFIEVKARHGGNFGEPPDAVTSQKQQRMVWMATDYLARHGLLEAACRFDVVGIDADEHPAAVTIIEDAFRPGW